MDWTSDQQKVIDTRNKNILVSAAAGSGKTAVLVERIIKRVTDKDNPVNVDQLLIVTFTKAAAAQMREKIHKAIEKEVEKSPDNEHLAKQLYYIRNAQISTIDGFCSYLIKNYYDRIDLNPGFRVADESELGIIRNDIVKEVLEDYYTREDKVFEDAVDSVCYGNSDEYMEEIVQKLYNVSTSHVDPLAWLKSLSDPSKEITADNINNQIWIKEMIRRLYIIALDNINQTNMAISICEQVGGPLPYKEALEADIEIYNLLLKKSTYQDIVEYLSYYKHDKLKRISKKDEVDEELKGQVQSVRNACKESIKKILKDSFAMTTEKMLANVNFTVPVLAKIAQITVEFSERFAKYKEEKNIIDFTDIEHFALKILTEESNPDKPTQVARQLSEFYEEILIDEYQDSNDVQEAILTSIGNKNNNKPEIFMVGDVKQSIYGFRMAKPELFIEKSKAYPLDDDGLTRRIDLHKNFRSRDKVLELCNYIFERSMSERTGRIAYTDEEKLYPGATYPQILDDSDDCELLIYNTHKNDEEDVKKKIKEDDESVVEIAKDEANLRMIAVKIKELIDENTGAMVTDEDSQGKQYLRRAKYSDIVILFRSIGKGLELINDVFMEENIPIQIENTSGYFSAMEIRVMLNMLRIVNNPLQDIPLVSVLRSPIASFSNEEIGKIRCVAKKKFLYEAMKDSIENDVPDELKIKIEKFITMLTGFRKKSLYMSLHELILNIYDETGYYECVLAMNDGRRRRMNLDMLVNRASAFEKTSYCSLFNFIRAMDKMDKYTIDFGQAGNDATSDCVRIMTIHKSKGLEFPICIVAGIGKQFNTRDITNKIIVHQELGLGMDYVNHEHRIRTKTLSKKALGQMIVRESIDEELRVLYVAMTRAKEKLILAGAIDFNSITEKNMYLASKDMADVVPASSMLSLKSYMELIIMALMKTKAMKNAMDSQSMSNELMHDMTNRCPVKITIYKREDIEVLNLTDEICNELSINAIRNMNTDTIYNEKVRSILEDEEAHKPYEPEEEFKMKVSVSELKKISQMEHEEMDNEKAHEKLSHVQMIAEREKEEHKKEQSNRLSPAQIGTMYHKVFEILPLGDITDDARTSIEKTRELIKELVKNCSLLDGWEEYIDAKKIYAFLNSQLACRMAKANRQEKLKREQQFVLGMKAKEVYKDKNSDSQVLIQGIIDAYFEENDEIVLMDYKTDHIAKEDAKKVLSDRYSKQLDLYQNAIERLTHKKVKERIIYCVALEEEISM